MSNTAKAAWFIVDNAIRAKGTIDVMPTGTDDKRDALAMARKEWFALSDADRKARDDFYIGLAASQEDAQNEEFIDTISLTEGDAVMKRFHVKEDYLPQWGGWMSEDDIVTTDEVELLAEEWNVPVSELLKQLAEVR